MNKKMLTNLSQEYLKSILDYDQSTGVFTWKINAANNVKTGSIAGCLTSKGYIEIVINKTMYKAHRLAWLYVNGSFPIDVIDHINGERSDNRICNLREATHAQNMQNQIKPSLKNTTGYLGVTFNKATNKYRSFIMKNGKRKFLGGFESADLAHEAYLKAKREIHEFCTI